MLWIIQLPHKSETEIWSDEKLTMMYEKCMFYGATPHWKKIKPANDLLEMQKNTNGNTVPMVQMRKAR
jgi:hypothetical protein